MTRAQPWRGTGCSCPGQSVRVSRTAASYSLLSDDTRDWRDFRDSGARELMCVTPSTAGRPGRSRKTIAGRPYSGAADLVERPDSSGRHRDVTCVTHVTGQELILNHTGMRTSSRRRQKTTQFRTRIDRVGAVRSRKRCPTHRVSSARSHFRCFCRRAVASSGRRHGSPPHDPGQNDSTPKWLPIPHTKNQLRSAQSRDKQGGYLRVAHHLDLRQVQLVGKCDFALPLFGYACP